MADFPADATNTLQDSRSFPASGTKAGVESGLGSVESLTRGAIQDQQRTVGTVFRQESVDETTGSEGNGKNFKFRY